ncbi:MAG: hypothetical protein IJB18_02985, partial [Clostridia bacterium]|nr:hypothetical protein [Clostridia bacterium]
FADVWAITVMDYACHLFLQGECLKWFGRLKKSIVCAFPLLLCIVFFDKMLYANQIYLKKSFEYDSTLSIMTRVIDRLEQLDGYKVGETPVVLCGSLDDSGVHYDNSAFAGTKYLTGFGSDYAVTYEKTYWWYFEDVMEYSIKKYEHPEEMRTLAQVKEMPTFPQKGCVAMIDGIAIVKFSNIIE